MQWREQKLCQDCPRSLLVSIMWPDPVYGLSCGDMHKPASICLLQRQVGLGHWVHPSL